MQKEKKTALEIAALIEERIARCAKIVVWRDHHINGWYAQVLPGELNLLAMQAEVDKISDALRERYELKTG
jgi:hypothetical protein